MVDALLYFFILFFKQKTAYEMRISDWSSDVCSSDLFAPAVHRRHAVAARGAQQTQQYGFGLVIAMVGEREHLGFGELRAKRGIAGGAGGGLKADALIQIDADACDMQHQTQPSTDLSAKIGRAHV